MKTTSERILLIRYGNSGFEELIKKYGAAIRPASSARHMANYYGKFVFE